MGWILLAVAVTANIASNLLFKNAMAAFPATVDAGSLLRFAFNPYLLLGVTSCAVLLGSYLLALREIDLMTSYAFVISLSLVGITVLSALLLGTQLSPARLAGVALVISGILLLTFSHGAPSRNADGASRHESVSEAPPA
jgi:multidrug transporter EmrE-like cation transporter